MSPITCHKNQTSKYHELLIFPQNSYLVVKDSGSKLPCVILSSPDTNHSSAFSSISSTTFLAAYELEQLIVLFGYINEANDITVWLEPESQ